MANNIDYSNLLERIERLENNIYPSKSSRPNYITKIIAKTATQTEFISIENVYSIEADGRYSRVYLADSSRFLPYALKRFESALDPLRFARVHKSWIISIDSIRYMENIGSGNYIAILANTQRVRLSRRYSDALKLILDRSSSAEVGLTL